MSVFKGIVLENSDTFYQKEKVMTLKEFINFQVPTARFWLMLKIRNPEYFSSKYDKYILEVSNILKDKFDKNDSKKMVNSTIEKILKLAWITMPTEFLNSLKVPRVIRK